METKMTEDKDLARAKEYKRIISDATVQGWSIESEIAERLYRGIGGFSGDFKTHDEIRNFIDLILREERRRLLNDPRIKELVLALKKIQELETKQGHEKMGCDEPCYCALDFSEPALNNFESLLKENEVGKP
jgi:hypothetical protein